MAVTVAVPAFAAITYSIWAFVLDGESDAWRWGWAGILALLAALIAVTARLLARSPVLVRLAWAAGLLAVLAATTSYVAIWRDESGDALGRTIAILWILSGLAYLLVPVLQRFAAASTSDVPERLLAELDGIEVVATRSLDGLAVGLHPSERLVVRRRV